MEKAVTGSDLIAPALSRAQTAGSESEPFELLRVASDVRDPLAALADMDRSAAFFDGIRKDFGFVHANRTMGAVPSPQDLQRLDGLMRWLVREFASWRAIDDPLRRRLVVLFVTTRYCEMNGAFWPNFPASLGANAELLQELGTRIAGFQFDIAAHELSRSPISDKENIEAFRKSDIEGNWPDIEARWHSFERFMPATVFLSQAVQCLNRYSVAELVKATNAIQRVIRTVQVLAPLTIADALGFALASPNPYVEFAATLKALPPRPTPEATDPAVQQLLTQLLIKISADAPRWGQWMEAFNRYPSRYPTLHVPLGHALATVPAAVLAPYVDSIILSSGDASRKCVGDCLRAFRAAASAQQRCALWALAHDRWLAWDFGLKQDEFHLTRVTFSELDYALVGYAIECISPTERDGIHAQICAELSALPTVWHFSHGGFLSASFRLLSRLQPFLYAQSVGTGDWLRIGSYALPFDPKADTYVATLLAIDA